MATSTHPDGQKAPLDIIHVVQRVVQRMLEEASDVGALAANGETSAQAAGPASATVSARADAWTSSSAPTLSGSAAS